MYFLVCTRVPVLKLTLPSSIKQDLSGFGSIKSFLSLISKNWNPRGLQRACIHTRNQPLTPSQCCGLFDTLFSMTVLPVQWGAGGSRRERLEPDTPFSMFQEKNIWKRVSRR